MSYLKHGEYKHSEFYKLVGKVFTKIHVSDDEIDFFCKDGEHFKMLHFNDCCESVYVEDICGDLLDLLETPIVKAEEATSDQNPSDAKPETIEYQKSFTWTFYKLDTAKGGVTIRWYGESNGYYSESVSLVRMI